MPYQPLCLNPQDPTVKQFINQYGMRETYRIYTQHQYWLPDFTAYQNRTQADVLPTQGAMDYLQSMVSLDQFNTDNLANIGVELPQGTEAAFWRDTFYFGDSISRGALSEEAFHAVFQRVIPGTEQQDLLDTGKQLLQADLKVLGHTSLNGYYQTMLQSAPQTYENLSKEAGLNRLYEEKLATEFVRWNTYGKQAAWEADWTKRLAPYLGAKSASRISGLISRLFTRLKAVMGLYDKNRLKADLFFSRLRSGVYQTAKVTEAGNLNTVPTTRLIRLGNGQTVSVRESTQLLRNLGALVLQLGDHDLFSYLSEPERIEKALELMSSQYGRTPGGKQVSLVLKPTYFDKVSKQKEVNPEYQLIKADLEAYLGELRSVSTLLDESEEDEIGGGINEFAGYDKEANEIGGFAGLSTWVKQFIARTGIPRLDSNGLPQVHTVDTGNGVIELPILDVVDPQQVYTGLARSLSNTTGVNDRLEKLLVLTQFDGNPATRAVTDQLLRDMAPVRYQATPALQAIQERFTLTDGIRTPQQLDRALQIADARLTARDRSAITQQAFTRLQETSPRVLREELLAAIRTDTLDSYLSSAGKNVLIRILKGFDLWKRDMLNMRVDPSNGLSVISEANVERASKQLLARWESNWNRRTTETPDQLPTGPDVVNSRVTLETKDFPLVQLEALALPEQTAYIESVFDREVDKQLRFLNRFGIQVPSAYLYYRLQWFAEQRYPALPGINQTRSARLKDLYPIPDSLLLTPDDLGLLDKYVQNPAVSPYQATGSKGLEAGMRTRLQKLAEGAARFDESAVDSSYQNAEGKTIYSYQQKTYSLEFFNWFGQTGLTKLEDLYRTGNRTRLRDDPSGNPVYLQLDSWALQKNRLLKAILTDPAVRAQQGKLTAFTVDGTTQTQLEGTPDNARSRPDAQAGEGVTYGGMSPREFDQFNLNSLVSRSTTVGSLTISPVFLGNRETSKTGEYMNLPLLTGLIENDQLTDKGANLLLDEIQKEYERIQQTYKEINPDENGKPRYSAELEKAQNYHTGKSLKPVVVKDPTRLSVTVHVPSAGKDFRGLQFTDGLRGLLPGNWQTLPQPGDTEAGNLILSALAGYDFPRQKLLAPIKQQIRANLDEHLDRFAQEGLWKADLSGPTTLLNLRLSKARVENKLVSDLLNNIAMGQLAYGDAALLYKNDGVDVFKRLKGLNAAIINFKIPFSSPAQGIDEPATYLKALTIGEPTAVSDVSGGSIDLADAQGYQSVQARRKHLYGAGRLDSLQVEVLDAIQEGKPVRGKLLARLRESGIMYNSEKTVGADGQQYKKLSETILSKELTADPYPITKEQFDQWASLDSYNRTRLNPGSPEVSSYIDDKSGQRVYRQWVPKPGRRSLNELRLKMDGFERVGDNWQFRGYEHRIDLVTPLSASKTLNVNVHETRTDAGQPDWGQVDDRSIHQLDFSFYGLQTENPSGKTKIVDPTQMLEIIANELGDDARVWFEQEFIGKNQIETLWQSYLQQRDSTNYQLAEKVFQDESGNLTLHRFRQQAFEAVIRSGKDKQTVDLFDPQHNLNLNLPLTRDQFISQFFSHFSKGVLSHKRAGDSLAHVSSFGHQVIKKLRRVKLDDGSTNITWDVIRDGSREYQLALGQGLSGSLAPFRYKHEFDGKRRIEPTGYTDSKGNTNSSWFSQATTLLGDQDSVYVLDSLRHLKPRLEETAPGSNVYRQTGYFSEALMPVHDDQIRELTPDLRYSFGVRIPSQDKHSAMNVEWVDTLPVFMGSSVILPKEVVELSGSDFDIDKLYLTRFDGYWKKDRNNRNQFVAYGSEQTDEARWESYVHYLLDHYPAIKRELRQKLQDPTYQDLAVVVRALQADQSEQLLDDEQLSDWTAASLQLYFAGDLAGLKAGLDSQYQQALSEVLSQFGLPASQNTYTSLPRAEQEALHVGIIQNRMLSLQQGLLANDTTINDSNPTGGQYNQPAALDKLNELKGETQDGTRLFGESVAPISTHWQLTHSRVHQKNGVGKALIGIGVNTNLFLINAVRLGFQVHPDYLPKLDDNRSHDGIYRAQTVGKNGEAVRSFDINSTIITADTDEAKEALNAYYQLNSDTQAVVLHLTGIGYSLLDGLTLVNQPVIQRYVALTEQARRVKRGIGVISKEEEGLRFASKDKLVRQALGLSDTDKLDLSGSYTVEALRNQLAGYRKTGTYQRSSIDGQLLTDFQNLVELNEYASNFVRFIKLKKGFGRELPAFDQLVKAGERLGFGAVEPEAAPIDIKAKLEAKPRLAAQYLNLINQIVPRSQALQQQVILRRHPLFTGLQQQVSNQLNMVSAADQEILARAVETFLLTKLYQQQGFQLDPASVYQDGGDERITRQLQAFQRDYAFVRKDENGLILEKSIFADNPIFELLQPVTGTDGTSTLRLGGALKLSPSQQENLLDAFQDLYTRPNQPVIDGQTVGQLMATRLVNYHLVKEGFQFTVNSISRLFPPAVFAQLSQQLDQIQANPDVSGNTVNQWSADLLTSLGRDVNYQTYVKPLRRPTGKNSLASLVKQSGFWQYQTADEQVSKQALTTDLVLDSTRIPADKSQELYPSMGLGYSPKTGSVDFPRFIRVEEWMNGGTGEYGEELPSYKQAKTYELVSVIGTDGKVIPLSQIEASPEVSGSKARYVEVIPSGAKGISGATGLPAHYSPAAKTKRDALSSQVKPGSATANYYGLAGNPMLPALVTGVSQSPITIVEKPVVTNKELVISVLPETTEKGKRAETTTKFGVEKPLSYEQLGTEQKQFVDKLQSFVLTDSFNPRDAESVLVLEGSAGTGKTTSVKVALQQLLESGRVYPEQIMLSAPTHTALKTLFRSVRGVRHRNRNPMNTARFYKNNVKTVQSLLGAVRRVNQNGELQFSISKTTKEKLLDIRLLIIDEASMISNVREKGATVSMLEGLQGLQDELPNLKILYIGDPNQIPPVNGKESVVFSLYRNNLHRLTQVFRQSMQNPVIRTLTRIREKIDQPTDPLDYKSAIHNGEGIVYTGSSAAFMEQVRDQFTSDGYAANKDFTKVISYTNQAVQRFNQLVRRYRFGDLPKFLEIGDVVMGYANTDIINGQEYEVRSITENHPIQLDELLNSSTATGQRQLQLLTDEFPRQVQQLRANPPIGYKVELEEVNSIKAEFDESPRQTSYLLDVKNESDIDYIREHLNLVGAVRTKINATWSEYNRTKNRSLFGLIQELEGVRQSLEMINFNQPIIQYQNQFYPQKQLVLILQTAGQSPDQIEQILSRGNIVDKTYDYGYAITAHKAQGKTYVNTLINLEDIDGNNDRRRLANPKEVNRIRYVALSRATGIDYVLTPKAESVSQPITVKPSLFDIGTPGESLDEQTDTDLRLDQPCAKPTA
ncbi:AAA domain-containing protein [Spirosoma oryzae]|uniref:AAA domain-containing protein n=1 Tax=Spirosoma oryzae TaxID=1469603 RepID=A0A2T0SYI0_9BACT|nr:PIF1 family ATP-dependent DNA helicase [Spirosoma oryzae]PRY38468.1 AAA domain-containing protein [Spirosoma oryzae]